MTVLVLVLTWGRNDMALAIPDELNVSQELTGNDNDATMSEASKNAQTFQLTKSGRISRISLYVYAANAGDTINATINLRQGPPTAGGTILGTATAVVSATATWYDFNFATPVAVTGGTTYHYEITFTSNLGALRQGYKITAPGSSPYAGGDHWNWTGTAWEMWNDADLAFRVYLALNQNPTLATNSPLSLNEGATATVANTNLNSTDPDNDTITYTIGTPTANGSLKKGASILLAGGTFTQADINAGQITYMHSSSDTTTDSFTFTAADGKGGTIGSTTFTINITPVNDAPTFTLGSNVTVLEDSSAYSATNFVTARSAVEAGQTLTTTVTNNNNALFSAQPAVDGSGTLTFTPAPNANGTATVTVTVQDNGGTANGGVDTTAKSFSISITAVNDAPSFTVGANQTVAEDAGAQTVPGWVPAMSAGPADEAAQSITFTVTNSNNGLFAVQPAVAANGQLTYTPAANANGVATVTVQAQDSGGTANGGSNTSAAQSFTITVTAVNDPPVGGADTLTAVDEDSSTLAIPFATLLTNDSAGPADESGQTLTIAGVTAGTGGTVAISGGNVLFTPAANFHGTASFTYSLSDGTATAPVSVTIPVTPVADSPSVTSATTAEDTQSSSGLVINRNAVDGAEVTHFQITGITGGKLYLNNGTTELTNGSYITYAQGNAGLKFTPSQDLNGSGAGSFTVKAATNGSGAGLSAGTTATINVTAVNDAPTGVNDALAAVAEDASVTIPFADLTSNDSKGPADENGQTLTVSAVGSPIGGTVSISGTDVIFTLTADYNGPASFTYTVQDNGSAPNTGTATASFTVYAVNDAPVGTDDTLSAVDEDSAARTIPFAALLANDTRGPADESGQTLTITSVSSATGVSVSIDGTNLVVTPVANFQGVASFTYTLADNGTTNGAPDPKTDTATVSFTVNGMAEAPTVTTATTAEDTQSTSGLVITPDVADGAAVTHFQITGITGGSLYKNDGSTQIANGDFLTAAEGAAGLKFTPIANQNSANGDTFGFTAQAALDGTGTGISGGKTVAITVTEVNDAPTGTDDNPPGAITEDYGSLTFNGADLLTNDSKGPANESGQSLSITNVDNVVGGTAMVVGGNVQFTTAANFFGTASFRYTLSDNGTTAGVADPKTSTATVTFTVTPIAELPTITPATTAEDTKSSSGLVITPDAADGAGVTHFKITGITGGTLYQNDGATQVTNGTFITVAQGAAGLRFMPGANQNSPAGDAFAFTAQAALDGTGTGISPTTTTTITVTEVNDAPTGVDDDFTGVIGYTVTEDAATKTFRGDDLLVNDSFGPGNEFGQSLSVTAVDNAIGGTASVVGGNVVFIPTPNFYGTASFRYTLSDDGTTGGTADPLTSTATATFTVRPVADTPQITPTTTAEDTQSTTGLVITRNAVDGAEVTHFEITGITGGTLYQNDGTTAIANGAYITAAQGAAGLKFTPNADQNTPAGNSFGFTAKAALDGLGTGLSGGTPVTITVTDVNDAPIGTNDTLSAMLEDAATRTIPFAALTGNDLAGPVNESGQALTITAVTAGIGGTVTISGTDVLFTPAADFYGTATFTYTVQDNGTTNGADQFKTSTVTVSIPVTAVADTPTVTATTTAEDTQSSTGLVITRNAVDGAEVTHFQITGITGGKLYLNNGTTEISNGSYITAAQGGAGLKFTPAAEQNTPAGDAFAFTVKAALDGSGAQISGGTTASITVTEVNDAPSGANDTLSSVTEESGPRTIAFATLLGNDQTGPNEGAQTLTVAAVSGATGGTVTISGTDVIFTPDADFNGTASFTYTVQDNGTTNGIADPLTATATVSFTVTEINDAPTGTDDTLSTVTEDSAARTISFASLLGNDSAGPANESGQTLTISAVGSATGGTATISGTDVLFTLAPNFHGTASFIYTVRDNGTTNGAPSALTDTAQVTFTVTPVADLPGITGATTPEDTQTASGLVITPNAADGAEVTHFKITGITGGALFQNDGTTPIANGAFITVAAGGTGLKFTPNADLNTPAGGSFTFTVQAAQGASDTAISGTANATITVTEVNDDPTGHADTIADIAEDSGARTILASTLLANDEKGPVNESGQTLRITAAGNAVGGTVTVVAGNVVFTPEANFDDAASFDYTLTDDGTTAGAAAAKSSTATVTFNITPMPDAPQITTATTAEDTRSSGGLVITPNALDGVEITHYQISSITGGTLFQNDGTTTIANGEYITAAQGAAGLKFTPNADQNTPAGNSFGFTAKAALDGTGTGLSGGTPVTITVTEVNDAPTGTNETLSAMLEDAATRTIPFATLTGNDQKGPANESGQSLTITAVSAITGGTVTISGTDVLFTPAANFYGTATFTYTVQDDGTTNGADQFKTSTATVSIPVTAVADTPTVTPTTTAEDTQSSTGLVITRSAVDGVEVTHFQITGITGGKLYLSNGTTEISNGSYITAAQGGAGLKFTPAAEKNTLAGDAFTFTVKAALDGSGAQISGGTTASITVSEVNDRPTGVADTLANVAEDSGPWTIPFAALTGNDSNGPANESGQARTVVAVGSAVGGTVSRTTTDVIFTPNPDFNGAASFTYTVEDDGTTGGVGDPKTAATPTLVTFTVTPVNDAPVGNDDVLTTVAEDSATRTIAFADLLANDSKGPLNENGQSLSITAVSAFTGGTAVIEGTTIKFTLGANFHGTAGFTYTVSDDGTAGAPGALTDTAQVTFTVTPVADLPGITGATTPEDTQTASGLVITPNAADGVEVTHFKITGITGGALFQNDGTTPIVDGDFITVAAGGTGLKFTPNADLNSFTTIPSVFTFTVQAAQGASEAAISGTAAATITVTEVNDDPTGHADTIADIAEDASAFTISGTALLDNDDKGPANESGQTLTVTAADMAVGGTVSVEDGNVVFTPNANFFGPASFRYTLTDNGTTNSATDKKSSTATVSFTITPTPDVPQITTATTAEDTQSTAGLVVTRHTDDGAEITHFQVTAITGGRLYKKDGSTEIHLNDLITAAEGADGLKFTPNVDANSQNGGTFSVSLKAHDSLRSLTGPAGSATITVTEVNDDPWGADDTLADRTEDDPAFRIPFTTLLTNDVVGPNEADQHLTIISVSGAVGGTVAIDGTDLVFTPAADFTGPASFTYTLQDDGTTNTTPAPKTATAVVRFTITEVNDAPTGTADTLTAVAEDSGPWTIPFATLTGNDSTGPTNESSQHLTITQVGNAVGGTVAIAGTDVIFTPTLNFNGTASFTYTLQDDGTTHGTADPQTATAVVPVSFTVTPVNDAPVATDQSFQVIVGRHYTGTVTGTDVEGNALTYALVSAPTKGILTLNANGSFDYSGSSLGTDTFTFKANDGLADSAPATVTVTVNAEPIIPVLTISVPATETRESSILVSGTTNPNFFVVVNSTAGATWSTSTTVQANSQGHWSTTVALQEGPNTITASTAGLSRSVTVTRDTRPPQIELMASATRTDAETVVLTAFSEQGALIEIEGQPVSTLTVSLKMGNNRFTATATDKAGNKSTDTVTVLRVGNVPPAKTELKTGEAGEASTQYFKVQLPGEAVTEPTLLQVTSPSLDSAAIRLAEGAARSVMTGDSEATGQTTGSAIHVLPAPATITFIYDPAKVPNPSALRIYYFDPTHKVWVEVGGVVNSKDHSITVKVEHFTTFAAMEPQQDAPILSEPPAVVKTELLTVTGTSKPGTPVTLVVNRVPLMTALTGADGRFTLQGRLTAGRNWVYVKGTGTLASREMTVTYQTGRYTDIGQHWAEASINRLADLGVVSLYPEPLFQPEARVTRLEFAVMVSRVLGLAPVNEKPTFTDTDSMPAWALPEMAAAVKAGIIKGMPDGSFAPDALVNRAEMAVMLTRALQYAGKEASYGDKDFTDGPQIPTWALQQVLVAARYGLITGYPDGSFQAGNSTTRAEAITMLNRLVDVVSK